MIEDLARVTESLIEGEAALRMTLSRLFHVIVEDDLAILARESDIVFAKQENDNAETITGSEEAMCGHAAQLHYASVPLVRATHVFDHEIAPEQHRLHLPMQSEQLDRNITVLMGLVEDEREYVERLEDLLTGLCRMKALRDFVWKRIRSNALQELVTCN